MGDFTFGPRILIIGCGAAGKLTLAGHLGRLLSPPVIHLDHEQCQPGWRDPTRAAWTARRPPTGGLPSPPQAHHPPEKPRGPSVHSPSN